MPKENLKKKKNKIQTRFCIANANAFMTFQECAVPLAVYPAST